MRYRIILDTSLCEKPPERVQQYLSMTLDGLEVWAAPLLKRYPNSVVYVFRNIEKLELRGTLDEDGKLSLQHT